MNEQTGLNPENMKKGYENILVDSILRIREAFAEVKQTGAGEVRRMVAE